MNKEVTTTIGVEEAWRFDQQEREMMREAGHRFEKAEDHPFDYRRSEHDYLKHEWPDNDRITRIVIDKDADALPENEDEAMRMVSQRFGCIYKALSENMRRNVRILFAATVESSGHELAYAPEDMRENLSPAFFIEAMRAGAQGWILKWTPEAIRRDKVVQRLAIENHHANAEYILDPDEEIQALIEEGRVALDAQVNGNVRAES